MLLYEKYTPYTLNGLIGNRLSVEKLRQFGMNAQACKKPKPIMVYGPSGTGKTCAIRAIAYSNGFELVELTSSDYRDADTLRKKLLPAASCKCLSGNVNLILFDEIDELSSKFDKGAESVILEILQKAKQPIAFTANDYWDQRISFLRNHVEKVEFKKIETREIAEYLKKVAEKEKIPVDDDAIREISARCDGDIRSALNDLQMVMLGGNNIIDNLGIRNRKLEVFRVLDRIFLTNDFSMAKSAIDSSELEIDMLINWVEENIPNRYWIKNFVGKAYAELACASRFLEMSERVRYYGYVKYASTGIAGIAISSGGSTKRLSPYAFPSRVKYLSTTKGNRGVQNRIAIKLSPLLHTNKKDIINSYLPMFRSVLTNGNEETKKTANEFLESLELDKEEIAYMKGTGLA
jgi:replication factor C large subunit